jgi:hypothetical protein
MSNNNTAIVIVKKLVVIYGVVSALVLATVAVVAIDHGTVSLFMWIRAGILLLAAPLIYHWVTRAAQASVKSLERLRTVSLVLPIAIVVVDLIPGMCPMWYTALQGVSAIALVAVAIITRRGSLLATHLDAI